MQLNDSIKDQLHKLNLHESADSNTIISSIIPNDHVDNRLTSMWIPYGRSETELNKYYPQAKIDNFMNLQVIIRQKEIGLWLMIGKQQGGKVDREYFRKQMLEEEYRNTFFKLLVGLGAGYWIEIAGEKVKTETFQQTDSLWEFTKTDDWMYYTFLISKAFAPSDIELSTENIAIALTKEFDKLILLYRHIKDTSFEMIK